jgi:hypothetical protein
MNSRPRLGGRNDDKSQPIIINKAENYHPEEENKFDIVENMEEEEKKLL